MRILGAVSLLACFAVGVFLIGCGNNTAAPAKSEPPRIAENVAPKTGDSTATPPAPDKDKLAKETLERAIAATVFITCRYRPSARAPESVRGERDAPAVTFGSGFVVDARGLIVTNRHVVETWYNAVSRSPVTGLPEAMDLYHLLEIQVRTRSGTGQMKVYRAEVLGIRELPDDLALLRIRPDETLVALPLGTAASLELQQPLWAVGFPLGGNMEESLKELKLGKNPYGPDVSVREGKVTSLRRDDKGEIKAVENSCQVEHGNSGGPVINAQGEVVAVTTYGIGERSPNALTAERISATFGDMLSAFGSARKEGPRVLKIAAPGAAKGTGEFESFESAVGASRAGDTIEFAEGEYALANGLDINASHSLEVRGRGQNRTKLRVGSAVVARPAKGAMVLLCEMSIIRERNPDAVGPRCALSILAEGGRVVVSDAALIHESPQWAFESSVMLKINARDRSFGLMLDCSSNAEVYQCRISGAYVGGREGRSRIEGAWMPEGYVACETTGARLVGIAVGSVVFFCREENPATKRTVSLEGCEVGGEFVSYSNWDTTGSAAGSNVVCNSCRWTGGFKFEGWSKFSIEMSACCFTRGLACELDGANSGLFSDCLFLNTDTALRLKRSTVVVRANRFAFTSYRPGNPVMASRQGETDEQRVARIMRDKCTGLELRSGCNVTFSRNHFSSSLGGIAVLLADDVADGDAGDNVCRGSDEYKRRE